MPFVKGSHAKQGDGGTGGKIKNWNRLVNRLPVFIGQIADLTGNCRGFENW